VFGVFTAVNQVSFELQHDETLGLNGPNGPDEGGTFE
jgi:ABC-type branched-subunit amino acid transport system ATPase component